MRNPVLEQITLKALSIHDRPLHFWALANSVAVGVDDPELTRDEFIRTLQMLEEKKLIKSEKDALDYTVWSITALGKSALYI